MIKSMVHDGKIVTYDPPRVLPPLWCECEPLTIEGIRCQVYEHPLGYSNHPLRVLVSVEDRGDAGVWLHVSLSHANKLPNWREVREVKDIFIGPKLCAIHMIPPDEFYVNFHPFTLHLFARLDAPTVPPRLYEDQ